MEVSGNNSKFEEALHLLNEAAKEKKDEIQKLLIDKYADIKSAVQEAASAKMDDLERVKKLAKVALDEGEEKLRTATSDLNGKIRKDPWPYLGGVAIGALLMGFLMGSSKRD